MPARGPQLSPIKIRSTDLRYADLIRQHKDRAAMVVRGQAVFTGFSRALMSGLLWLIGPALLGKVDEIFRQDVVIEAQAEAAHDSRETAAGITAPTLVVGSTDDFAFPAKTVEAMARRIPGAQLKLYPGGHTAAFLDKRFYPDVRAFTQPPAQA